MRTVFLLMFILSGTFVYSVGATPFIGAKQCGHCHPKEFRQWQSTPHARTESRLSSAERRDPQCTQCHSPRIQDGFSGVQCESCHGAGHAYWPAAIMKDPAKARAAGLRPSDDKYMCLQCHHVKKTNGTPFDIDTALKSVVHSRPTVQDTQP